MNRKKVIKKTAAISAIVILVLLVGLHVFLSHGITESTRKWALPMISARTGLEMRVEQVSANPLAGSITLHGVHVVNPQGFEKADMLFLRRGSVTVGLLDLLSGSVTGIRKARVNDGLLTVIRNAEGNMNVREIGRAIQRVAAPIATPSSQEENPATGAQPVSPFRIGDAAAKLLTTYVDHKLFPTPVQLSLHLDVRLQNIVTCGPANALSGAVSAHAVMAGKDDRGTVQLHGMLGPVGDPTRLSFVASAKIEDLSVSILRLLAEQQELKLGWISGSLNLQCNDGVFDPEKSALRITFHDTGFTGRMKEKMQGMEKLDQFTVIAPISGTLAKPQVDLQAAMQQAMLGDEVLGAVLRHVMEHGGQLPPELRESDEDRIKKGKSFDLDGFIRKIRQGSN